MTYEEAARKSKTYEGFLDEIIMPSSSALKKLWKEAKEKQLDEKAAKLMNELTGFCGL